MENWIIDCLSSVVFAVIVNGGTKKCFKGKQGIRQWDPLSHFLFTLVVDVLSWRVNGTSKER